MAENHILVIDDEPVLLLTFKRLLEQHGYVVSVADNGQEGLEMVREHQPNLVITDLYMPEYDGYATIERLQQEYPDLPIIAMSAIIGPAGRQRTVSLGAACCVTKPVDMALLLRMVDGMLNRDSPDSIPCAGPAS